jgi:hypothetical protein
MPKFDRKRADAMAARLDLDPEVGICLPCLSIVSTAIEHGGPGEIQGAVVRMTPILWDEGLAEPALAAVRAARDRGVPGAAEALADVESKGGRSPMARAIVKRLGEKLLARMKADAHLIAAVQARPPLAPVEWN